MEKKFQYGGQALIEGVMMRGPSAVAIAVRQSNGEIVVEKQPSVMPTQRYRVLGWPLVRGTVVLIDSLVLGMKALNRSAVLAMPEEEEQLTGADVFLATFLAIILAVGLFIALPTGVVHYTKEFIGGVMAQNLVEGIIRIAIFLLYIIGISRMPDIRRVFMYHGAEHKAIYNLESGKPLSVENARNKSTLHPRCGTSFLLIVLVISILVFALLGEGSLLWRVGSRLAMFPVVAGLGYEFIKLTGAYADSWWARILMAPGLWLQNLTTSEPDDSMIEVALRALEAVLDQPAAAAEASSAAV